MEEIVIETLPELERCCEHLKECPRFGFDTEFIGEESYHPKLCLVQVATPKALYLLDPLALGSLDPFWKLVIDPAHRVVVHAGREEVRLCHLWSGQSPGNLFDLQIAAGLVGMTYPLGHGNLVQQVLGRSLPKGETLTEWRTRPLTPSQIRYAFDDVRFLLPIEERLSKQLSELGREAWATEEFAKLLDAATPDEAGLSVGVDKWRKLRGAGSLDRRRLATLRALFQWREEEAASANRPARTIVRDDLLVEIAKRGPKAERDLFPVRGLAKRYLTGILEVVSQARTLPNEECPMPAERDQDPPQVTWVVNVLNAVLADFCVKERLAPNLAATSSDVKALVRSRMLGLPLPPEHALSRGWRASFLLPRLEAFLTGKLPLRIGDLKSSAPFTFG